jgi:Stress responsive A/B Barrel Domain
MGETAEALVQKLAGFFFMILTPPSGINLIHILFTPGICPPGLRLQIRNHDPTSQEKTGTLFCLFAQKNLDGKSSLALSPVSLGADCLADENVVRRRAGGSVIDRILVCFGRPRVTQKGSPRREFARNSDTKKTMRRFREISPIRLGAFARLAICSSILLGACQTAPPVSSTVTRVVLIWLKHPERSADRAQLSRAAHSLRMIPGVLRVQTGRTVPTLPSGADRSFNLGVVITFRDRAALQRYEKDPRHLEAMRRYLQPLVRRYEIYNSTGR